MKNKITQNTLKTLLKVVFCVILFSVSSEIKAQVPGVLTLTSPLNNTNLLPGKTIHFTWNAPPSGATPFTYTFYFYNGSSWVNFSAGSNLYYDMLLKETGSSSLCGVSAQWYVKATNSYGSTNSATWNFVPYPKYSRSPVDYSITPSTSCQSGGADTIVSYGANYYSFSATAGYSYYFSTCNSDLGCGTNTTWNTYLKIYGTNGSCTTSATNDDGGACGNGTSFINGWTCSSTGTYILQITGYDKFAYGTYYLQYKYTCPTLSAGSVGSNQSVCYNTSPSAFTQTAAPSGGTGSYTYQWQNTTVSGCGSGWADISGATATTYQAGSLTQSTCYRRVVTSGACGSANSNSISVTVYANLTAGSVGSTQSICYNTSPAAFTQTGAPSGGTGSYTYQWQNSSVAGCGSGWGNISGATATTYQAPALTATNCYRRFVTSGSCGTVSSSTIIVTVYPNLTAGSVGSTQSICYNTSPAAFTQTGAPSGGTGSYTYQWQNTTIAGCGSGWGNISGATATTYQAPALTATTCYRRNVTSGSCGTVSSSAITVTVYANLTAGSVGSAQSICYNTSPGAFTQTGAPTGGTGSYTYQWQNTTDPSCGSGWGNISGATATTYQTSALTATTCYRRNVTSGSCGTVSSSAITVTVIALPNAEAGNNDTINAGDSIQIGSSPVGGYTYAWSPATGLSSTTVANPWAKPIQNTTYYLTVTNSQGCINNDSVKVTVLGTSCLNAIEIVHDTICNEHEFRFVINQPEYWFKFTATDTNCIIKMGNTIPILNDIEVYVYENNCNSLNQLFYFSNNDSLNFFCNSLQDSQTYYINIINNQSIEFNSDICLLTSRSMPGDIFIECSPICIDNLIINGDFEIPDSYWGESFYSEYTQGSLNPQPLNPCQAIVTDQNHVQDYTLFHGDWWAPGNNHSTSISAGYYLIANGNSDTDNSVPFTSCITSTIPKILWRQTISGPFNIGDVYYCRYWTTNLYATIPESGLNMYNCPAMQLLINGQYQYCLSTQSNNDFALPSDDENWHQLCFEYTILDPPPQSITLDIVTGDIVYYGNDLAIDDIEFGKAWEPEITVTNPLNNCIGQTHTLTTSGGDTYLWSTDDTTSIITVSPNTTTTYTVTVTQENGCSASNNVVVEVAPLCDCAATTIHDNIITSQTILNPYTLYSLDHDITISGNVSLNDVSIRIDNSPPNNMINIFIPSNATLTLNHCHLFACTRMWEGISVSGSGRLVINNGTLIEDARNAVYITDLTNPASNTLCVNSSVFNKNYKGVYIKDYQATSGPYPFSIKNSVFTSRDFYSYSNIDTWPRPQHTDPLYDISALVGSGSLSEHYSISQGFNSSLLLSSGSARTGICLENTGILDAGTYLEMVINGNDPNIANSTNIFDNMNFGIEARNSNFTSTNNAFQNLIAELPNSNDNGYGIYAINASANTAEYQLNVTGVNKFYDCTFGVAATGYNDVNIIGTDMRSTQEAIPPYSLPNQGAIGIYAATPFCNAININDNNITNIRNGIVFFGDADVTGTQQIIGDVTIDGNTIQASLHGVAPVDEYTYFGIYAANIINYVPYGTAGLTGPIIISNNNLYNVHNGIFMQGWNYLVINGTGYFNRATTSNNYISLRKIKYPDSNNYPQFGIMHSLNWSPVVSENTVDGFNNYDVLWHGITMNNNLGYGDNVEVNCNEVNGTGTGIRFVGEHGNTIFENNIMDDNQWGYVLNGASIGQQGNTNYACGNLWTNFSTGNFKTYTLNVNPTTTEPTNSTLYVNINEATQYPQAPFNENEFQNSSYIYSLGNGFLGASNNNSNSCGGSKQNSINGNSSSVSDTSIISWFEKIALDSIHYAIFDAEQRINAKHRLYRILKLNSTLLSESIILKHFYLTAQNSNMALLAETEHQLAIGAITNALSVSSSITPSNAIEQNYADFYRVYLNYKQDTVTANDSITLLYLVNGCVPRDGISVLQARALYSLIYNDFTTHFDDCNENYDSKNEPQISIQEENSNEIYFRIYPNPNTGQMKLDYNLNKNESGTFTFYDISGRKVSSYQLKSSRNSLIINETMLKNGIYYYNININSELVKTDRIIIIK